MGLVWQFFKMVKNNIG